MNQAYSLHKGKVWAWVASATSKEWGSPAADYGTFRNGLFFWLAKCITNSVQNKKLITTDLKKITVHFAPNKNYQIV